MCCPRPDASGSLQVIGSDGGYASLLFLPANMFVRLRDEVRPRSSSCCPCPARGH